MRRGIALLVSGSMISAACSTPATKNIQARLVWGDSLRHLGIKAFYPPRADVHVGDIFLYITSTCQTDADAGVPRTLWLGKLDPQVIASINRATYGWSEELPALKAAAKDVSSSASGGGIGEPDRPGASSGASKVTTELAAKAIAARKQATDAQTQATKDAAAAAKAVAAAKATASSERAAANARALAANKKAIAAKKLANLKTAAAIKAEAAAKAGSSGLGANLTAGASSGSADETIEVKLASGSAVSVSSAKGKGDAKDTKGETSKQADAKPASGSEIAGVPEADKDHPIFMTKEDGSLQDQPRPYTHLRQAAFPTVALGSYSRAGFDANVPVSGFGKIFGGASRESDEEVRVSASNIVEDQLPIFDIYGAAEAFFRSPRGTAMLDPDRVNLMVENAEADLKQQAGEKCGQLILSQPQYIFVTQVYYAHSLDFEASNKLGYAAALRAELAAAQASTASSAQTMSGTPAATAGVMPVQTATGPYIPPEIKPGNAMGGGLHFEVGETGSVILKQTFQQPLAFGYESAVSFFWNQADGIRQGARGNVADTQDVRLKSANTMQERFAQAPLFIRTLYQQRSEAGSTGVVPGRTGQLPATQNIGSPSCPYPPKDIRCRPTTLPDPFHHGGTTLEVQERSARGPESKE